MITYAVRAGQRNGVQRRTRLSFGRTMMQALELLRLAKGVSLDEVTLNSEEIKAVAIVIIESHLSEDISKGVSQSVRKFD